MCPGGPPAWGWREYRSTGGSSDDDDEQVSYRALGSRIGWIDGEDLYLEPDAAYAAVQRLARDQGDSLTVSLPTLKRRLHQRGVLASTEERGGRTRLEIRRTLEGKRRTVLHLHAESLMCADVAQVAQVAQEPAPGSTVTNKSAPEQAASGPQKWATNGEGAPEVAHESGPIGGPSTNGSAPIGPLGPLGPLPEGNRAERVQRAAELLRLGERLARPELHYARGQSIAAGVASWQRFAELASEEDLAAALCVARQESEAPF